MSTITKTRPMKAERKDPMTAYREAVFAAAKADDDNEPDAAVLDAAGRLPSDYVLDTQRYRRRLNSAESLAVDVPRMEQEAEALRREIEDAKQGGQLVADCKTIRELFNALRSYELANANNVITDERLRLSQLNSQLLEARRNGQRVLTETADPSIADRLEKIQKEINAIGERSKGRSNLLSLESRIASLQREADALKERDRAKGLAGITPVEREKYRSLLAKVRELELQRPQVDAAVEADAADRDAIARLQQEAAELAAQRFVPERMLWES